MNTPPLLIERTDEHLLTWTLNRPEQRNPISEQDMVANVEAAVADVASDATVRAIVLTGAGSAFSSGGNIKHMRDKTGMFGGTPSELRQGYRHGIQRIARAVYHCEVPIIAAVNGPAIGAGCDLALMCDLRLASTSARFAESFVKVGLIPGDGGAWLLPRIIGNARAAEMTLTGDAIDAQTALSWGLVSAVHEPADLLAAAYALARRITVNPPQVVRMSKRMLRESQHQTLEAALEYAAAMQSITHHMVDHMEAVNAMIERREPRFRGG